MEQMHRKLQVTHVDGIVSLVLNRPEALNALERELLHELAEVIGSAAIDPGVQGVVISGSGRAFCAGGDLKWVWESPRGAAAAFHRLVVRFHQAIIDIRRMAKPVIAAIHGVAAGGGFSLALACDFRVMGESAVLRQAYTSSGLSIDGGGSFMLPRLVGVARALEIMALDEPIDANRALAWGLATRVVPDGEEVAAALAMVRRIASGSLHSFGWSKRLINDSFDTAMEVQLERERIGLCACSEHPDGQEGMRAFMEKRPPVFPGAPCGKGEKS